MKNSLEKISELYCSAPDDVAAEIQIAIDKTWAGLEGAELRSMLFPEGKPAPEIFIRRMAVFAIEQMSNYITL